MLQASPTFLIRYIEWCDRLCSYWFIPMCCRGPPLLKSAAAGGYFDLPEACRLLFAAIDRQRPRHAARITGTAFTALIGL